MASNLYYRLLSRGYSVFFDLEQMQKDDFNSQLLTYIENSKDVFVILEAGSLDACNDGTWRKDWFCLEIAHALLCGRNIIPILVDNYKMPDEESLPNELKKLSKKSALEFSIVYFENYLDRIEKNYLTSYASSKNQAKSVFKFYSDRNCQVFKDGRLVCNLEKYSEEPYYLPILRKGEYRFKCVFDNGKSLMLNSSIDIDEEKIIHIINRAINRNYWIYILSGMIVIFINIAIISFYIAPQNSNNAIEVASLESGSVSKSSLKGNLETIITATSQIQKMASETISDSNCNADLSSEQCIHE